MNDNKAFVIFMAFIITVPMLGLALQQYHETQIKLEAIRSGLVQKIDPETKEPIWTKP